MQASVSPKTTKPHSLQEKWGLRTQSMTLPVIRVNVLSSNFGADYHKASIYVKDIQG